jgi:predicted transcriptional regulator YdeE
VKIVKTCLFTQLKKDTIGDEIYYTCYLFREDERHDVFLTFSEARKEAIELSQINIENSKLAIKNSEEKIKLLMELKDE